jgi:hypothetical protein
MVASDEDEIIGCRRRKECARRRAAGRYSDTKVEVMEVAKIAGVRQTMSTRLVNLRLHCQTIEQRTNDNEVRMRTLAKLWLWREHRVVTQLVSFATIVYKDSSVR